MSFGARTILDRVDFSLATHEIAVIDGPSGGGKSTLLRALAGLVEPARGTLSLDGAASTALAPSAYRVLVAYVPQLPVMFPGTVADNVRAGPRLRGLEPNDDVVADLLRRVALDPSFAARTARDLSGGEKQRVAIARALANEPRVILFDEPTSALDPAASEGILQLLRTCAAGDAAVVVVTHAREQARALGGTHYSCSGGHLERTSPP